MRRGHTPGRRWSGVKTVKDGIARNSGVAGHGDVDYSVRGDVEAGG